jgi:hypothetical protein
MKKLSKLYESLFNESTDFSAIFYHGSPKKFEKFSDEFVGGEDATDQEGPGIYFTTSAEEARSYGEFIYEVRIDAQRFLDDETSSDSVNVDELYQLVKMADEWEMNAQDWAEDPDTGAMEASYSAIEYNDNEKDCFLQMWIGFYRYDEVNFVRNMVKLGYDGILINRINGDGKHAIVYNLKVVEFMGMLEN